MSSPSPRRSELCGGNTAEMPNKTQGYAAMAVLRGSNTVGEHPHSCPCTDDAVCRGGAMVLVTLTPARRVKDAWGQRETPLAWCQAATPYCSYYLTPIGGVLPDKKGWRVG